MIIIISMILIREYPRAAIPAIVEKMPCRAADVRTGITYWDFLKENEESAQPCTWDKVLYTGMIDEYFDYCLGALEYRSLRFETQELPDVDNFQGNAVVNYTEREVPYTRIIEHKHFEFGAQPKTVITREYSKEWKAGDEPYYPVNNDRNTQIYQRYRALADREKNVRFGGRLGTYRYFDMHQIIGSALDAVKQEFGE